MPLSGTETEKCLHHPQFKQLIRARGRFSLVFSLMILLSYGLYVLGMCFAPTAMAQPFEEGGSMTYGILMAVGVILWGMICSGIYSWWANRHFEAIKHALLKDLGYE